MSQNLSLPLLSFVAHVMKLSLQQVAGAPWKGLRGKLPTNVTAARRGRREENEREQAETKGESCSGLCVWKAPVAWFRGEFLFGGERRPGYLRF